MGSAPNNISVPPSNDFGRSNQSTLNDSVNTTLDHSSRNRESIFEGAIDRKPVLNFGDGVDRKPIISMLDHKPIPLNFDHAPFVETKPDVNELDRGQVVPIRPVRTFTNPPKIPGLKKTIARFSYRGLNINYDINTVYLDLINCRGIAAGDEDFYLFCATYGLLVHDWNSGPSIDDRIRQGYWPAQVYHDQIPTSVLVFCISDQELLERTARERSPLFSGSTLIDQPEPLRRSGRVAHQPQAVIYVSGHDTDSD